MEGRMEDLDRWKYGQTEGRADGQSVFYKYCFNLKYDQKSKKCSRRRNSLLAPLLEAKFELSLKAFKSYPIVKNKQK